MRRPLARARTPSLSRTTLSPASSPPNSTPQSTKSVSMNRSIAESPIHGASVPLPPSYAGSPATSPESNSSQSNQDLSLRESDCQSSMEITELHVSPIRTFRLRDKNNRARRLTNLERQPFHLTEMTRLYPPPNSQKSLAHKSPAPMSSGFSSPVQSFCVHAHSRLSPTASTVQPPSATIRSSCYSQARGRQPLRAR